MKAAMVFLCAIGLLLGAQWAMDAAREAAQVFVDGVLPALFPMMVLGRLAGGGKSALGDVAFGWLAGSPAAAQRAAGRDWLLAITGVMSPMFFLGTLTRWTGNAGLCLWMLIMHWAGAGIASLFRVRCALPSQKPESAPCTLPQAVSQAASSALSVCGAMMLFSIAAAFLRQMLCGALSPKALAVLWALLEIGGGAHAVVEAFPDPPWALLCALCSFGGLSIWLQNLLFLDKSIRPAKLLVVRALHGAVSYGLMRLYFSFLKIQNLLIR